MSDKKRKECWFFEPIEVKSKNGGLVPNTFGDCGYPTPMSVNKGMCWGPGDCDECSMFQVGEK